MLSSEWLHCCGERVYLFDWFKCVAAGYASGTECRVYQPPHHHFLRHGCYFNDKCSGNSKKRRKSDGGGTDPLVASCAQCVRRAVCDDWHRPMLSWIAQAPQRPCFNADWPEFVGKFDSAALLRSGSWQPFLQVTMENACDECSTLEIGAAAH